MIQLVVPAILIAMLAPLQVATAADAVMTAELVAQTRTVTAVAIAPDGRHIAYVLSVPRRPFQDDNGPSFAELHLVDKSGASRPFVTGKVNVSALAWTPDGQAITYLAKRFDDKEAGLYQIAVAGGESRRILAHDTAILSYTLSTDGRQVAFLATDKEQDRDSERGKKGFDAEVFEETARFTRVWIASLSGDDKPRQLDLPGNASEVHFSPSGDRLALALANTPLIDDSYMSRKVHVVDVATGAELARFENPGKLGAIEWNPDGTHLALISAADRADPEQGRLMVAEAGGGPLVDLLPDLPGHVTSLAWQSADTVMFLADQGCYTSLEKVKIDGSERHAIVPAGRFVMSGLSLSNESQSCALLVESSQHPAEVFTLSHADPTPRRLTDSNPWLAGLRFAQQEVVRYPAQDGLEIEGVLIHPLDAEPGRRYPLVLTVHGGPEAHDRDGWLTRYSAPGQVAAAQGIAVFHPNYRGSTGRGVAFSKLGQGDYAGAEFDDLIDAVDHLIDRGLVDRDRVGITGGSYGGYATAWCATRHTTRFAAGVMMVGISDLIAKTGTTDIPEEMFLVHATKRPWDDWQFFLERSPIYHVQQARTPLLILHGKDDTRVHPSQSLELYRQLKVLGNVPVRFVQYPGEGHGNRKAAARYDYNLRMMQWFLHYLKGDGGEPPAAQLEYPLDSAQTAESPATDL